VPIGTAETLHGRSTLEAWELRASILGLKLYHARKFQPDYQQLMTEAPLVRIGSVMIDNPIFLEKTGVSESW
jgi:hypothetical protein